MAYLSSTRGHDDRAAFDYAALAWAEAEQEVAVLKQDMAEAKRLLNRWIAAFYKGDEELCHDTLKFLGEEG